MALHLLPSDDVRTACRQRIEACELWLRRLVHDRLRADFGDDYVETAQLAGQAVFRADIRAHVTERVGAAPGRYARPVDTLQLDHLASVICKVDVYKRYFREAMAHAFPVGNEHLRLTFARLVPIRNALAHANALSVRDAERVLCYCDDIIVSLAHFYETAGMTKDFDAPSFTRFSDSIGNVEYPTSTDAKLDFTKRAHLRAGEGVRFEVEVDSHYPASEYTVAWQILVSNGSYYREGTSLSLTLDPSHVSMEFAIMVKVTSNKEWHRHGFCDASLLLLYVVLPPA